MEKIELDDFLTEGILREKDFRLKIDKVFELLSDHPFLVSNPENARKMAEFRIFSLKIR